MEQKTPRLYPSAPQESSDFEKRLEKKLKDVNRLNNSITNLKKLIDYFEDKNCKSKEKYGK